MKRTYNKLVRNKIPEIIEAKGEKAVTKILTDEEYWSALLEKALEELNEVKTAEDLEDQRVILGFLSTICLTSAMCSSWILTSGDVCTLSSLRISLSLSSDVLLTSLISVSSF